MNVDDLLSYFESESTPLVRTDFSDDDAWQRTVALVSAPMRIDDDPNGSSDYRPNIVPIDDRTFEGLDPETLALAYREDCVGYVLLADATTMATPDDPTVLYVDLDEDPGRSFRCAAPEIASIEANLSIANMDFEEFADAVGEDGVFRGFEE
ncbi:DUF6924 domain-containing protein [Nocardioides sp. GXZ039]|uniref:DUF6924 domain-containing protein n=1 Tax=Nocardioides sp. GXZ039 TaxID=3136018 RepID=UPI0030F4767B